MVFGADIPRSKMLYIYSRWADPCEGQNIVADEVECLQKSHKSIKQQTFPFHSFSNNSFICLLKPWQTPTEWIPTSILNHSPP